MIRSTRRPCLTIRVINVLRTANTTGTIMVSTISGIVAPIPPHSATTASPPPTTPTPARMLNSPEDMPPRSSFHAFPKGAFIKSNKPAPIIFTTSSSTATI